MRRKNKPTGPRAPRKDPRKREPHKPEATRLVLPLDGWEANRLVNLLGFVRREVPFGDIWHALDKRMAMRIQLRLAAALRGGPDFDIEWDGNAYVVRGKVARRAAPGVVQ